MEASIELPAGWVDRTVLTYIGPDEGAGSPSLVVTAEELGSDVPLARFAAMQDAAVRAGLEGVELLEERQTAVAGHGAVRHTYRWTMSGRTMRQRMWSLVANGTGYAIVASAADEQFDALAPAFEAAAATFRARA